MAFLALLILLAQNFALGKAYPWALLPYDLGRWVWIAASLGLVVLLAEQAGFLTLGPRWQRFADACVRAMGHRAALIALLAGNAVFAIVSWDHFRGFNYGFPWAHLVVLVAAAPFVRRDRFWVSCAVCLGLLIASIVHFPLDTGRSDLLTGISTAWDHLAIGISPYAFQYVAHAGEWTVPYLPGTLFAHAPAWVLGLDFRWNEVVWRLLWMLGLGLALKRLKPDSPWVTVAHIFALNPYYSFRHELYYEAFFALIVAYHAWPRWRWLALPALIWTRQAAWVMAPFLALDWLLREQAAGVGASPLLEPSGESRGRYRRWRNHPGLLDWRRIGRQTGWLALGAALVTGAVVLALAPTTTVATFFRSEFPNTPISQFDYGLTLGPLAGMVGEAGILRLLQAAAIAGLGLCILWRSVRGKLGADRSQSIERIGLLSLCLVVLLNPFFEVNFWLEPAHWMLAAYAVREPAAA